MSGGSFRDGLKHPAFHAFVLLEIVVTIYVIFFLPRPVPQHDTRPAIVQKGATP